MEGGNGGHVERANEVQHVTAIVAAPDPILMLYRDNVGARRERTRSARVVGAVVAPDPMMDLIWNNDDPAAAQRAMEAMLTMKKIDIAAIEAAAKGE